MQKLKLAVLGAALALVPAAAQAQWYVGGAGGYDILQDSKLKNTNGLKEKSEGGFVGLGTVGYDFGMFRTELEGGYRYNSNKSITGGGFTGSTSGKTTAWSGMVNGYWDILSGPLTPYIGAGVGVAWLDHDTKLNGTKLLSGNSTQFAYQGIAGVSYDVTPNWGIKGEYRYFGTTDPKWNVASVAGGGNTKGEYGTHNFLVGVTYKFAAPPPPPPPPPPAPVAQAAPPPPPPPAPAAPALPDVYVVFFAFDQSDISPVAAQVLDRSVEDFRRTGQTRVKVQGHTDTSGSVQYNLRLSERRADAVRNYMIQRGIPADRIATEWFGKSRPRVQTGDGVKNPENRRAEIYLEK